MGVKQSVPFPYEAVVDCCVNTVNLFGPVFVKACAVTGLETLLSEAVHPVFELQRPPEAVYPLETGTQRSWTPPFLALHTHSPPPFVQAG
jgi:hypothetical protein